MLSKVVHFWCCFIAAAAVIPLICPDDNTDCYPVDFAPTREWQVIREGQVIPPGLDIRLDWQTGEKSAKLIDREGDIVVKDNAIVHYLEDQDGDDDEDDREIEALKMAVQSDTNEIELKDAILYISGGVYDGGLVGTLEALSEYSHDLQNGIEIAEVSKELVQLATSGEARVKELALRVIAQCLRHNPEAIEVADSEMLGMVLASLETEDDYVLQKRMLGVISSLIQSDSKANEFMQIDGKLRLLKIFKKFSGDSQLRCLEIFDDLNLHLAKRDAQFDEDLFTVVQESITGTDDSAFEPIFDKLVDLKQSNRSFRVTSVFLEWLSSKIQAMKNFDKRDDELLTKLIDARHVVFGNPMALRKALADEL